MNKEKILSTFQVGSLNINGFDVGTIIRDLYAQIEASDPKGSFDKCMQAMADRDAAHSREDKLNAQIKEKDNVLLAVQDQFKKFGNNFPDGFDSRVFRWVDDCVAGIQPSAYCECPPGTDRCITQGGHFPACTACKRRIR